MSDRNLWLVAAFAVLAALGWWWTQPWLEVAAAPEELAPPEVVVQKPPPPVPVPEPGPRPQRPGVEGASSEEAPAEGGLLTQADIEAVVRDMARDLDREPEPVTCDDFIQCEAAFPLDGADLEVFEAQVQDAVKRHHPAHWLIPRVRQDDSVVVYLMRRAQTLDELGMYVDHAEVEKALATGELVEP